MGHKRGEWTEQQNAKLVKKMDWDGDGLVNAKEFIGYFEEALPHEAEGFERVIEQFKQVAEACRREKQQPAKREDKGPAASKAVAKNAVEAGEPVMPKAKGVVPDAQVELTPRHSKLKKSSREAYELFNELDTNKDGVIDAQEFDQAMKQGKLSPGGTRSAEGKTAASHQRQDDSRHKSNRCTLPAALIPCPGPHRARF